MKPANLLLLSYLLAPALSQAQTVDWGNYLQGIKVNCDTSALDNPEPATLKSSILKLNNQGKLDDGTWVGKKTITLKNATFMGQPLTKIVKDSNGYEGKTTLYFANTGFMQLRPQFYMETDTAQGKVRLYASDKKVIQDPDSFAGQYTANGKGYNDGLTNLNFDMKTKSISCSWAAA